MVRRYALVLGIIFLLAGLLGFMNAFTPGGKLLGILAINPAHNWIHLLTGILGIWAAVSNVERAASGFTWLVFIVYGLVTLLGFVMTPVDGMLFRIIHVNRADNWFHLIVSISALTVLLSTQRRPVFR